MVKVLNASGNRCKSPKMRPAIQSKIDEHLKQKRFSFLLEEDDPTNLFVLPGRLTLPKKMQMRTTGNCIKQYSLLKSTKTD